MKPENQKRPMMDIARPYLHARREAEAKGSEEVSTPKGEKPKKDRFSSFIASRWLLVAIVLLLAAVPSYYFYNKSKEAEKRLNDPNTSNKQVIDEVVKKAGHHILLPSGEQPTLATVSDASKVKGQPFFLNAQNGDKVLVYTQARKAYLYRPGQDIIIEVAPLSIDSLQSGTTTK